MQADLLALRERVDLLESRLEKANAASAEDRPLPPVDLEAQVVDVLAVQRQQALDREIDNRNIIDERALDELEESVELADQDRDHLEKIMLAATTSHVTLISEGKEGIRPWEEIRQELGELRTAKAEEVRRYLDEDEYALFAEIVAKHGNSLSLPRSAEIDQPRADPVQGLVDSR